jgi:UrcA family protein
MKSVLLAVTIAIAALVTGVGAYAEDIEGVTVTGSRIVKDRIGRAPSGAPINAISLSYGVSYADLDLGTAAGKAALEKRISEAANAACKEIGRLHPLATPDDAACARAAIDEAMVQVKKLGATAQ